MPLKGSSVASYITESQSTWWKPDGSNSTSSFLPSIATFTLDSTALHHVLFLLHNRRQVWPKRLWKRAEAKFTKLWFASKADRPTQTRSLHMWRALVLFIQCCSSAVRNGLLSDVFYSYMSAQVTIFEKLCTLSLASNAGSLWIVHLCSEPHNIA